MGRISPDFPHFFEKMNFWKTIYYFLFCNIYIRITVKCMFALLVNEIIRWHMCDITLTMPNSMFPILFYFRRGFFSNPYYFPEMHPRFAQKIKFFFFKNHQTFLVFDIFPKSQHRMHIYIITNRFITHAPVPT